MAELPEQAIDRTSNRQRNRAGNLRQLRSQARRPTPIRRGSANNTGLILPPAVALGRQAP
jgi:hypothetical protein